MFSNRTDWSLSPNTISKALDNFKAQGIPYIDLTASNPTGCQFEYPQELLSSLVVTDNLTYRPLPKGLPVARDAVAQYYNRRDLEVNPEDVFLTAGTSEAYSFLFRLLINSGEAALFPKPSYPLFEFLTDLNDVNIDYYPLEYEQRWRINIDKFEQSILADTQAVIFVNPNNPTGSYISPEEKEEINAICRNRKLPIISDEVFFDYFFGGDDPHVSFCGNQDVLTFTLGGLSKSMGLPQMKLSWILVSGPEKYKREAMQRLEIIADTFLSVNTPVQNALKSWALFEQDIQKDILVRIRNNLKELSGAVDGKISVELLRASGGWSAVLRLPEGIDEEKFSEELLSHEHVLVHPGFFYDFEEGNHIVLSLLPPADVFRDGVGKLVDKLS